jgi:uncharacterized NAD-dependent epimerase/dehydratase family protein
MARAIVLAEGYLGEDSGKTANGLVLHAVTHEIVAVIDSTKAGRDAGEVVAGKTRGIPVVATFEEALAFKPEVFYIGVATAGGYLPDSFREAVRKALQAGLTVYNGLHIFLSEDPEFAPLVAAGKAKVVDVRKPPVAKDLRVADGRVNDLAVPRVLVMGMDCDIGKRITVLEIVRAAKARGIHFGFVATGQTGCMLGPDAGTVIDRVPADFAAGQVEAMLCDVAARKKPDVLFIYGQSSIQHPSYSGVSLACLHGSAPTVVVLQVAPERKQRAIFEHPRYTMEPIAEEIDLIERLGKTSVVACAVNGRGIQDIPAACRRVTEETGLPAIDPLSGSADELLDVILAALAQKGFKVATGDGAATNGTAGDGTGAEASKTPKAADAAPLVRA